MHAELSLVAGVCVLLLSIPLVQLVRKKDVSTFALLAWLWLLNMIFVIDSIAWAGNVDFTPIQAGWCDLSTKIITAANIALPACCLSICVDLKQSFLSPKARPLPRTARSRWLIQALLCLVLPIVYAVLAIIPQDRRFELIEDIGCRSAVFVSTPAILLLWLPPWIVSILAIVFSWLAIRPLLKRTSNPTKTNSPTRRSFHLNPEMNLDAEENSIADADLDLWTHLRPVLLALSVIGWMSITSTVSLDFAVVGGIGVQHWPGLEQVHAHGGEVRTFRMGQVGKERWRSVQLFVWWSVPIAAAIALGFVFPWTAVVDGVQKVTSRMGWHAPWGGKGKGCVEQKHGKTKLVDKEAVISAQHGSVQGAPAIMPMAITTTPTLRLDTNVRPANTAQEGKKTGSPSSTTSTIKFGPGAHDFFTIPDFGRAKSTAPIRTQVHLASTDGSRASQSSSAEKPSKPSLPSFLPIRGREDSTGSDADFDVDLDLEEEAHDVLSPFAFSEFKRNLPMLHGVNVTSPVDIGGDNDISDSTSPVPSSCAKVTPPLGSHAGRPTLGMAMAKRPSESSTRIHSAVASTHNSCTSVYSSSLSARSSRSTPSPRYSRTSRLARAVAAMTATSGDGAGGVTRKASVPNSVRESMGAHSVLRGHISVSSARFSRGFEFDLDELERVRREDKEDKTDREPRSPFEDPPTEMGSSVDAGTAPMAWASKHRFGLMLGRTRERMPSVPTSEHEYSLEADAELGDALGTSISAGSTSAVAPALPPKVYGSDSGMRSNSPRPRRGSPFGLGWGLGLGRGLGRGREGSGASARSLGMGMSSASNSNTALAPSKPTMELEEDSMTPIFMQRVKIQK